MFDVGGFCFTLNRRCSSSGRGYPGTAECRRWIPARLWQQTSGGAKTPAQKRAQANAKKPGSSRSGGVRPPLGSKPPSRAKNPPGPCHPAGDHAHLRGFQPLPLVEEGERPPGSLTKNPCRPTATTLLCRFAPTTRRSHKPRGGRHSPCLPRRGSRRDAPIQISLVNVHGGTPKGRSPPPDDEPSPLERSRHAGEVRRTNHRVLGGQPRIRDAQATVTRGFLDRS
jgi:hypothetical protein